MRTLPLIATSRPETGVKERRARPKGPYGRVGRRGQAAKSAIARKRLGGARGEGGQGGMREGRRALTYVVRRRGHVGRDVSRGHGDHGR